MWIRLAGQAPLPDQANALTYEGSGYPEGFLFDLGGWADFGDGLFTGFEGPHEPLTITGFVTGCGDDDDCLQDNCVIEGDPHFDDAIADGVPNCDSYEPLGMICSTVFEHDPLQDAIVTVTYEDRSCTIEVEREPIG